MSIFCCFVGNRSNQSLSELSTKVTQIKNPTIKRIADLNGMYKGDKEIEYVMSGFVIKSELPSGIDLYRNGFYSTMCSKHLNVYKEHLGIMSELCEMLTFWLLSEV